MKFLDERIVFNYTFPSGTTTPNTGMYTYTLKATDETLEGSYTVFVGNFYYLHNKMLIKLDLTDIIRNNVYTIDNKKFVNTEGTGLSILTSGIYTVYFIELSMGGSTLVTDEIVVANVWRYPNRSPYNFSLNGYSQFVNINNSSFNTHTVYMLQGMLTDTYDLLPHYPLKMTEKFGYAATFSYGSNVSNIDLTLLDAYLNYEQHLNWNVGQALYSTTFIYNLSDLLETYFYAIERDQFDIADLNLYHNASQYVTKLIAVFDMCYGRYYLQWRDRFGSYQCQQFRDNATYSEDFNTEEIMTYEDIRRKSFTSVQPKWKLHSGWIKDELYPYYESIFTSPVLVLYDTETDMSYEVLVKGSYTEKNYKNQKTLVNIELDLEAANKQNIIY